MGCEEGIGWPCPWTECIPEGHGEDGEFLAGCQPLDVQGAISEVMWVCLSSFSPVVLSYLISHFLAEFFTEKINQVTHTNCYLMQSMCLTHSEAKTTQHIRVWSRERSTLQGRGRKTGSSCL